MIRQKRPRINDIGFIGLASVWREEMWPFDRKRKREIAAAEARAAAEREAFCAEIQRGGWRYFWSDTPTPLATIEIMRAGWGAPVTTRRMDIPALSNAYGLYWRPAASMIDITPQSRLLH